MTVVEIFDLQSGYTLFVGPIQGSNQIVKRTKVELFIDEKPLKIIDISGEFITNVKYPQGYRAISTTDKGVFCCPFYFRCRKMYSHVDIAFA
ncbi:hypothetical protein [Oscillatoria salina]|uniref:hypothetical protein n=1 Tax=Oscillatoria salina TaxID=331517 RepID=UPI0013BAC422|nr:hypothetical protein [Oscillatoria salina]MBZ8183289.1 hypothetical protein [Oscillatoria salina IIICB1]NET89223.1 hypothetical protein [Kamptonema sp. SIO1D9]